LYLGPLRRESVRILSLLDREAFSPTYGCMDRTFWAWKFVDFPGARFQEGLCYLSFLYATDFPDNPFYKNPKLLQWISGGLDFWAKIQRGTGDFDEAYPYERSLAATSFTGFYLGEAWKFLNDGADLPKVVANRFREAMALAGDWLIVNDEKHGFLSNHLAAAAGALYHAYLITGDKRYEDRSWYFTEKILSHQSSEGWYDEYGGADPGYQTHGSFYLARIWQLSGDKRLPESLERSMKFLAHFIHPDGSLGGEYTSRNTQTYYPAAFEMLAGESASASWIAQQMRPSVPTLAAAGQGTVDIYNTFPLLNNTVFAYLGYKANEGKVKTPEGPSTDSGQIHFPKAGLMKVRREKYDLYLGLHKGGVFKLFDRAKGELVASNCGYIGKLTNGKTFSNQWNDPEREVEIEDNEVVVKGAFYQTSRPVMDPYRFMAFRLFSLTAGRFKKAAYWIKSLLVKVLIYKKRELDLGFTRRFTIGENGVAVTDELQGSPEGIANMVPGENFTTIHMGSSRYFVPHELMSAPGGEQFWKPIFVEDLSKGVKREWIIPIESQPAEEGDS